MTSTLNLTVANGLDPPHLHNLPDEVYVLENVTVGQVIFVINASDIQADSISYSITPFPDDGQFYLTGASGEIKKFFSHKTP